MAILCTCQVFTTAWRQTRKPSQLSPLTKWILVLMPYVCYRFCGQINTISPVANSPHILTSFSPSLRWLKQPLKPKLMPPQKRLIPTWKQTSPTEHPRKMGCWRLIIPPPTESPHKNTSFAARGSLVVTPTPTTPQIVTGTTRMVPLRIWKIARNHPRVPARRVNLQIWPNSLNPLPRWKKIEKVTSCKKKSHNDSDSNAELFRIIEQFRKKF